MKVVLTHPFCWPHVRRGTERNIDELARYLTGRGHDVVTLSTSPDGPRDEAGPGGRRVLLAPVESGLLARLRLHAPHTFFFGCRRALRSLAADVVHSFHPMDGLASLRARRRRGYRTILQMNGVAVPGISCRRFLPPEGWLYGEAIRGADHRITCSGFIRGLVLEHYGMDSEIIPPLVNVAANTVGTGPPSSRPTILSVADFDVRRKGLRVLVRAFQIVRDRVADAVLRLSGRLSPELEREVLGPLPTAARSAVEVLGLGRVEDVPRQYREASVMALPAMWEPSGTVLMEAWSCGTPVVVPHHGGLPEFMADGVGVMFDPLTNAEETSNAEGLAAAIVEALGLAERPGTRRLCRAHAERFSWAALGPRVEALYAS
jgi:phosphatidyl-myo-inositol alpha-mannosyltransferase